MNCEKVQEILLTDHMDGRLDPVSREALEAHMKACHACREFWQAAQQTLVAPFEQMPRETLPEHVIAAIMEKVEPAPSPFFWIGEALGMLKLAAPVLAVAVLMLATCVHWNSERQARQHEQVLFLTQVARVDTDKNMEDYGTDMETYFLEQKEVL